MKTIMPFYAALIAALLLVTYVPDFSLLLPKLILADRPADKTNPPAAPGRWCSTRTIT
jgi:hypothetical protein